MKLIIFYQFPINSDVNDVSLYKLLLPLW